MVEALWSGEGCKFLYDECVDLFDHLEVTPFLVSSFFLVAVVEILN